MVIKMLRRTVILAIVVITALLMINSSAYATGEDTRHLMDAEKLSNNNIAVLFCKSGTSSSNVVTYDYLYLGTYNTANDLWNEVPVGEEAPVAKEAALALYNDKAHVVYITTDDKMVYIYQTDSGWSTPETITSVNANGSSVADTLSCPDIAVDSNGKIHVAYIDQDGAGDGDFHQADGMYLTNASGEFVISCVVSCSGSNNSPWGIDRDTLLTPIKIDYDGEDRLIAFKVLYYSTDGYGGKYSSYTLFFNTSSNETSSTLGTNGSSTVHEVCRYDNHYYTLISKDNNYYVYDGNIAIDGTSIAATVSKADMTLNGSQIYYAAINNNNVLFYQNGTFIEDKEITTPILSSSKFVTTVVNGIQYILYTGADEENSLVISKLNNGEISEYLVSSKIKTWSELQAALDVGGDITLTQDLIAGSGDTYLTVKKDTILDLNGYVLDRNVDEPTIGGGAIWVNEGVNFVINDSRPNATHTPEITYKNLTTNEDVVVNGGIITGGTTEGGSGAIYYYWCTGTINGGTIVGNKSRGTDINGSAGGIVIRSSTVTMNGGAICGNEAIAASDIVAGGVILNDLQGSTTAFNLNGGSITDNYTNSTSGSCFGGMFTYASDINVSGNPVVDRNMKNGIPSNVVLSNTAKGRQIHLTGELTDGAHFGVTTWRIPPYWYSPEDFTSDYITYNSEDDASNYFSLDDEKALMVYDGTSEPKVALKFTITVTDDGNGTATVSQNEFYYPQQPVLTATPNENYRLKEWQVISGDVSVDANNKVNIIDGEDPSNPKTNVQIKAIFELIPEYTVTFDANGGTGSMASVTQKEGTTYALPTCTITAPAGYEFKDWLVIPSEGAESHLNPEQSIDIVKNYTIKPSWKTISYTIAYDLDGGTVASANPETYTIESDNITLVNPTKSPFVFSGWTGTGLTEPTMEVVISKGSIGNRSYTATYQKVDAVLSNNPTAKTLTYTGNNQDLINAGTSEEGTVVYSLDGQNFNESIPQGKNAGNYTVYYKVIGDSYHNDSSVESIAVRISKSSAYKYVYYPQGKDLTYDGTLQNLTSMGDVDGGVFKYSLDGENFSETVPQGRNAGNYIVYYKIFGDSNHNDSERFEKMCVIKKANPTFTAPVAKENLEYTGENQDLINAGSSEVGTVVYSLDGENYAETVPQGKDAGNYTVYYKVIGDSNHKDSETENVAVTIAKIDSTYTAPTAKEGLVYTGENQGLVIAGTTLDGTVVYSLDGENYSEIVPQGKDVGTYTVYYKVQGDNNHNDSEIASINVEIKYADGLNNVDGTLYYTLNNTIQTSYTGLVNYNNIWYYVENGKVNKTVKTIVEYKNNWFYVNNGQVDWSYTSLCYYNGRWFYIEAGILNWNAETLAFYNNAWYKVKGGQVDWDYTGLTYYKNTWFYIENGQINWEADKLVYYNNVWFLVNNGQVDWNYKGLVYFKGAWFHVEGGQIGWNFTGISEYKGSKFYVKGGQVDWSYTGQVTYNGNKYNVKGGIVV